MRFVFFVHSLVSDWNHGNAHFLRGVMRELQRQGHEALAYEPADGWSRSNLLRDQGAQAIEGFSKIFPHLGSIPYDRHDIPLDGMLDGADVVVVHEWNERSLIAQIGRHRRRSRYILLFHDTHHRAATAPHEIARFDLSAFDGVLCFGEIIRRIYLKQGWARQAWTWHEAADTALFHPRSHTDGGDLVWIGNWGDGERGEELEEFLLGPIRELGVRATIHGVRYPSAVVEQLRAAGARYAGWLPNAAVPETFAAHKVTVHVPRRPYARALPGIPTIRVFEALACGIPLICAPWSDSEGLFRPGRDYLVARDGGEMTEMIGCVLREPRLAAELAASGLQTIQARHTCAHRVAELLGICGLFGREASVRAGNA